MPEPIYDGYTWPVKTCSRCGRVEAMPNDLCFTCREGDKLAEWLKHLEWLKEAEAQAKEVADYEYTRLINRPN